MRAARETDLRPGRARLDDVASRAGVSPITVSRTLRHPNLVAAPTREAVRKAIRELNYVPDLIAGSLASRRSGEVAIVVPSLNTPAFMGTVRGISEHLAAQNFNFVLGDSNLSGEDETRIIASLIGRRADAIILADVIHSAHSREILRGSGVPVVETWTLSRTPLDMNVGFDNRAAARLATTHLIETGRRHIGMICGPLNANARGRQRRHGFYDALKAHDLSTRTFIELPSPIRFVDAGPALARLKQMEPKLDAVFCSGDTFAVGASLEAQRRGWTVPDDLAIAGLGDSELADCVVPELTSVRIDGYRMGRLAAEMVTERLQGKTPTPIVDIGFELRVGGTTVIR